MAGRGEERTGLALKLHAPAEALERLADPRSGERFGPHGDEPLLAIDLVGGAGPESVSPSRREAAQHALASLPCPSVGIAAEPDELDLGRAALAKRLDVVVESAEACAEVARAVARQPIAAAALVQLLRLSEGRPVADGLVAESLTYSTLQAGPGFAAWLSLRGAPRLRPPETDPAVRIARHGDRLDLVLARPAKRNAFSAAMRDALCEALEVAVADASIREVTLSGDGPDFCSGGDLDEFGSLPDPATAHAIRTTRSPARLLAACAARVAARVHGACVGAGVELPAFAKQMVAAPDARFWLPELSMGLVPGAGGTVSLPRRIGRQRTAWMALTGARVDARTAKEWGLVDAIA
ncbi:MAG TPA: enoyl-CoA hydratase/isomerase family protein [Myxococcota bacterium]|nr:enoyl-CoA hydratase/isomerase family protein [Myxococcota bacterium]